MGNVTCIGSGVLFIKCKNCGYSWNTKVVGGQTISDKCPNCTTEMQEYIVLKSHELSKIEESVDIPEFMSKPKEVVTYEIEELKALTNLYYDLGKQKGLSQGITIGLIILGIVLFLLFAPMTGLPM